MLRKCFNFIVLRKRSLLHTRIVTDNVQLIKHPVCFPPPMMFGLRKFCLSIMTILIWMHGIDALTFDRSKPQGEKKTFNV